MSILHRRQKWKEGFRARAAAGPLVCRHTRQALEAQAPAAAAAADETVTLTRAEFNDLQARAAKPARKKAVRKSAAKKRRK